MTQLSIPDAKSSFIRNLEVPKMKHTLIKKHVLEALKDISDESIDCVVTSPPYYGLRSYKGAVAIWGGDTNCLHNFQETITHHDNLRFRGDNSSIGNEKNPEIHTSSDGIAASTTCSKCGAWKGQLGLELSYETYLGHLMLVTRELKRILKKSGTIFWNMGDSYAGNMGSRSGWQDSKYSESKEEGIENGESVFLKADYGKIGQKSLMMLPERFAIRMIDDGWILRNKLVWYKRNAMPSSVRDRFANKYEFVYFFSKAGKYYFNLDSVRKPLVEQRNKPFNIRVRDAKKGILEEKWGHLYSASEEEIKNYDEKKYHGKIPKGEEESFGSPRAREIRDFFNKKGQSGNFDYNEINSVSGTHYNEKGANPGDVLDVPTMPHKFAHFAIFPETLVEPLIKAGCPEDGTILDPFAGSGTVGTVARRLGRSSIMIEISKEYCEIIKERMQWGSGIAIEWKYVDDLHERYCHV